ncbi:MAG: WD40 repeat domain-containing serine/threonine-protein kinase [Verrucomicrobiales bacterium]
MDDRLQNSRLIEEVFGRAIAMEGEARQRYLDEACQGRPNLRARIEELFALDARRGGFMEIPDRDDEASKDPLIGSKIGPYTILECIGEGGYGQVYRAEQREHVTRQVALKVIKLGMDTKQVIARFEGERQALAMMEHPNIARIHDAGSTEQGRPYFVMELVRGIPITDFCAREHFGVRERLELFLSVCSAVQHAHQKGVIHRDLKPNNILVSMDGDRPEAKIIDFGIAKATGRKLTAHTLFTQFHQFIGTPAYMSPEQAQASNQDIDTRADIYALGILLYELLTGETPFDPKELLQQGQDAVFRTIREVDPVKPSTRLTESRKRTRQASGSSALPQADIARDLDWVVMKALEKDRRRRYDSASAFASDIRRFLDGQAVVAAPPSKFYQLSRFARRHWVPITACAAILCALVSGLIVAWRASVREHAALQLSQKHLYASDMKVAQSALASGDATLVLEKLEAHRPGDQGEEDLRGWFWRYLWGQLRQEQSSVRRFSEITGLAVSPSGQIAVAGGRGARAVDLLHGEGLQFQNVLGYSPLDVRGIRFSQDQTMLYLEQSSGLVIGIDLDSKTQQRYRRRDAYPLRITPDGKHLVGLFHPAEEPRRPERWVRTFQIDEGQPLAELPEPVLLPDIKGLKREFRVSPDGTRVTLCDAEGNVRVLSIPDLQIKGTISPPSHANVVAWSPDSRYLATGYEFPLFVDLWDVTNGAYVRRFEGSQRAACHEIAFSPDGQKLAFTEDSALIHIREIAGDRERTYVGREGQGLPVFVPDGETLVTAAGGRLFAWDATFGEKELGSISGQAVAYAPSGQLLAVLGEAGPVKLVDPSSRTLLKTIAISEEHAFSHAGGRPSLCFSKDNRFLCASTGRPVVTIIDLFTSETVFTVQHPARKVDSIALSPDGKTLVTAGSHSIAYWNAETGEPTLPITQSHYRIDNLMDNAESRSITFSPHPERPYLATSQHSHLTLFESAGGPSLGDIPGWGISSVTFSPDGNLLGGAVPSGVRLYRVPTLELETTIPSSEGPVSRLSFADNSDIVAAPHRGGSVQLWNRRSNTETGRLGQSVAAAAFSPDSRQLAVSSLDGRVELFNVPTFEEIDRRLELDRGQTEEHATLIANAEALESAERIRQFANDPGAIKSWLIVYGKPPPGDLKKLTTTAFLPNEATLEPRDGESVALFGKSRQWRMLHQDDYVIDFDEVMDTPERGHGGIIYAVTYLVSNREQQNVRILTGNDDGARIYLNGEMIYENADGWTVRDMDEVDSLTLLKGRNTIVFKIVNTGGVGNGALRFTDPDGKPLKGLRGTLKP